MPEIAVGDRDASVHTLVLDLHTEYERARAARGRFVLAIPGGSVGTAAFPAFATLDLDWTSIDLFWIDERAVPPTDSESNYALAELLWLTPARVPLHGVHRMRADQADLPAAAAAYGRELDRVLGPSGRLDFVLLGVGPDGHVASLFPGHSALRETQDRVVAIQDAPKPPPQRLTMTLPAIASARRVVVAAFGESKAAVLGEALSRNDSPLPVALVLRRADRPLLVADPAAARAFSTTP